MSSNIQVYKVIRSPLVSEKATMVGEKHNQYVFKINPKATKDQVSKAIAFLFKVTVTKVNILNNKSEKKRTQRGKTRTISGFKKAYVTLAKGDEIIYNVG